MSSAVPPSGSQSIRRNRRPEPERGSVTVVTAASLMLACVLCLVAVDLMQVLRIKSRAQTAADAAALAAARELVIPSAASPRDAAAAYAELNGATLQSCVCERGSSEAVVAVEMPVRLVFLSPTRPVVARARAVVEGGLQEAPPPRAKSEAMSTMPHQDE